ncbi:hypothetical protein [Notoacmeibacter ruber]|uniref:Phage tail protein n=1 Tax=Notoacmeibacter ruber TaxID=2670375 RepID=A0A3L7JDS7_9HYPH|nr:hypothetical protein [Notoacmeibacter ruber]RLQ88927.1 hypothetical protein D8780_12500 [Notoacmeibacter ruber]
MATRTHCSIGKAQLKVIGLNPEIINLESEARLPGAPTWRGMDYQATGMGERRILIRARTAPHLVGGLDALDWLFVHQERQEAVNFLRLGTNYMARRIGTVGVRFVGVEETKLHPLDGRGRIVEVEIDLVVLGGRAR